MLILPPTNSPSLLPTNNTSPASVESSGEKTLQSRLFEWPECNGPVHSRQQSHQLFCFVFNDHDSASYPIDSMKKNVDWAYVVAYDYHLPSRENATGFHAALHNSDSNISTDFGVSKWLSRGFPAGKLVLGLPFHGYAWTLVNPNDNAVGAQASGPAITIDGSIGFKLIRAFVQNYGY